MNNLCESVIQIDRRIKFVCRVDENAKLLAGLCRPTPTNYDVLDNKSSIHSDKSKIDDLIEVHFKYRNMYFVYSDYLLWVIKSCTSHLYDTKNKNKDNSCITHITNKSENTGFFELSGLDSDNVKLIVMPLNIRTQTFLCIYFQPSYRIKSSVADANKRFKNLFRKIHIITSVYSNTEGLV